MSALNEALNNQRTGDRFCSAVHLRLSPTVTGVEVVLANGGHPPALVLRHDGRVEAVDQEPGLLLGLFEETGIDQRLRLDPGDAIVLYTDGVIEAREPSTGEQYGQERFEALLARFAGRTANGIARRLELAVIDHQDGGALDDVAVVVIRADPRAGSS
ncbi:MAG: serine/threonine-protein phosphatase [Actinomycetota bacterium]|nr:serine/threonine-protein phosphatase [Actinomycetota bacterium]